MLPLLGVLGGTHCRIVSPLDVLSKFSEVDRTTLSAGFSGMLASEKLAVRDLKNCSTPLVIGIYEVRSLFNKVSFFI